MYHLGGRGIDDGKILPLREGVDLRRPVECLGRFGSGSCQQQIRKQSFGVPLCISELSSLGRWAYCSSEQVALIVFSAGAVSCPDRVARGERDEREGLPSV